MACMVDCDIRPVNVQNISVQFWTVIVFLGLGFILDIIALALPQWNQHDSETWGLWLRCTGAECSTIDDGQVLTSAMAVGRTFEVLGFICYVAMVVLVVIYLVWRQSMVLISAAIIISFCALFLIILGAILWASSSNTSISWGYYICYPSGLAASAVGGILIYVRRQAFMQEIEKNSADLV